jgi:hypothetical protein
VVESDDDEAAVLVVRSPKSDMSLAPPEKARLPSSLKALAACVVGGRERSVKRRRPREIEWLNKMGSL